jgi:pyridoxamine 5'-phosphate oxidase
MDTPIDPASSRYDHVASGLHRRDLDPDPIKQFSAWFTAAIEAMQDVNAMSLATATRTLPVRASCVVKGIHQNGLYFHQLRAIGEQLEANPHAAMAFLIRTRPANTDPGSWRKPQRKNQAIFSFATGGEAAGAWVRRKVGD